MFLKYLEISRHTDQILEEKLWSWRSYFWLSCRLFTCNFFLKWIYTQAVFRILIALKRPILRNTSEWLLPSNLQHFFFLCGHLGPPSGESAVGSNLQHSIFQHFVASSLFQFLMTSPNLRNTCQGRIKFITLFLTGTILL